MLICAKLQSVTIAFIWTRLVLKLLNAYRLSSFCNQLEPFLVYFYLRKEA